MVIVYPVPGTIDPGIPGVSLTVVGRIERQRKGEVREQVVTGLLEGWNVLNSSVG